MHISLKILLAFAALTILEPPGPVAVAKNAAKRGTSSKTEDTPLSSNKTEAQLQSRTCAELSSALGRWLCHAAQATLPEFTGGNAALYIINRFLGKRSNQNSPLENSAWNRLTDELTQYLDDSLSPSAYRNIRGRLEGFRVAHQHCKTGTRGAAKTRCLHNLWQQMLVAEGTFKGHTTREKSLLLKYFDRFTIIFNAVTKEFKQSYRKNPPQSGSIDIRSTFKKRQCSFYNYMCESMVLSREYACRHIYLTFWEDTMFDKDLHYNVPPERCQDLDLTRTRGKREVLNDNRSKENTTEVNLEKRGRGCGPFAKSRTYSAWLYNSKTDDYFWESRSFDSCSKEETITKLRALCVEALSTRTQKIQGCITNVKQNYEEGMKDRLEEMRRLGGRDCHWQSKCNT